MIPGLGLNADTNIAHLFEFLNGASAFEPGAINNVHGDGLNFVSMNSQFGLVQPGAQQEIYIESAALGQALGHSATQMTDSLALYSVFAKLDPRLDTGGDAGIDTITQIIKASSNVAERSLESALNGVYQLFVGTAAKDATNDRETYYANLALLNSAIAPYNAGTAAQPAYNFVVHELSASTASVLASTAYAESRLAKGYCYAYCISTPLPLLITMRSMAVIT